MFTPADGVTAALLGILIVLLVAIGARAWLRSRVSAAEKERRRRARLMAVGKMGDANLVEIRDRVLLYSYAVRGVQYTASQDVTGFEQFVPRDLAALGSVCIRYDPRNPANSIVVAEQWSGLRPHTGG